MTSEETRKREQNFRERLEDLDSLKRDINDAFDISGKDRRHLIHNNWHMTAY